MDAVAETKRKPFCANLGAEKIGRMSGVDASAPTVRKALDAADFERPKRSRNTHIKRVCRKSPNDQWNIDNVQLGRDSTGKPVESLSVIDDHSRLSMSSDATTESTTDHVIEVLEGLIEVHGKPRIIRSDHGSQWYSTIGGECRFDAWCESKGIRHDMSSIRTPQENGKVERYHGNLRTEVDLPAVAEPEEYSRLLDRYRHFYNNERPHWSLGLRTPIEVYNKTDIEPPDILSEIIEASRPTAMN